jgi:hypothetical protein
MRAYLRDSQPEVWLLQRGAVNSQRDAGHPDPQQLGL